jgi:hypothetical protein
VFLSNQDQESEAIKLSQLALAASEFEGQTSDAAIDLITVSSTVWL